MANAEKIVTGFIVVVAAIAVFSLFYASKSMFFSEDADSGTQKQTDHFSSTSFTAFDVQLAKKLMDKDNDGKCDFCSMDVELCIQSGQLQCTMDSSSTIGILDTTKKKHHYHADFKVYINGNEIDFNQEKYFVKSKFIHVENDAQGDSGKVIHMHASGVPLWIFFESLGMKFGKECFTMDNKESYCNNAEKTLKFYVNGKESNEFEDYVFNDLDKILISYGSEDEEEINNQLNSVTDFSRNH